MAKTPKQAAKTRTVERRTSAAGPYAGYSTQTTRFVHYLLIASRDDAVCLEVFGDVGLEEEDGSRTVEEDKFTISGNPLSDRAIPFWKTIRNWVESIASGKLLPENTQFIIYATRGDPGAIARAFVAATNPPEVEGAISLGATALSDQGPGELFEHMKAALSDKPNLARLLPRLSIKLADDSPIADLRHSFAEELISEDSLDDAMNWTLGWVKRQIDEAIGEGMPARITKSDFHARVLNYCRTHDRLDILRSVATRPSTPQVAGEVRAFSDYLRQLKLIEVPDVELFGAASDYLRACADRTEWAEQGYIDAESLGDFEEDLKRVWSNKKDKTLIGHSEKAPHLQGRLIYRDCQEHRAKVDQLEAPDHFVRGSWHSLADQRAIGWHPQYVDLLDSVTLTVESLHDAEHIA